MTNINLLFAEFIKIIPNLVGAIIVLIVGYIVAKAVQAAVRGGLRKAGMDKFISTSSAGNLVGRVTKSPAGVTGKLVFWVVWLGAISLAVSVLGISALTAFVAAIYAYLPNVIAAALILLGAIAVSAAVSGLVARLMGDTPTGKLVASITPGVIFSIAIFMVLNQLKIAPTIVTITYAAILGSVALGTALAFGLGGRGVAARLMEQGYSSALTKTDQAKSDLATGAERGKAMAEDAAQNLSGEETRRVTPAQQQAPAFGESVQSFQNDEPKGNAFREHDEVIRDVAPPESDER
jgi:hypothetical protein